MNTNEKINWIALKEFNHNYTEWPEFVKGMGIECYNGIKGIVVSSNFTHVLLETEVEPIHKMDIKAYLPL